MNWKDEIVKLIYLKQALKEVDAEGLWTFYLPKVAASSEELEKLKSEIDFPLSNNLMEFLSFTNGWDAFYQDVNLFGTADYLGSELFLFARKMFSAIEDGVLASTGFAREDFIPIAVSTSDRDIFALSKAGEVFWFAGDLIDKFDSFDEFYLAMLDYHREEINHWKNV